MTNVTNFSAELSGIIVLYDSPCVLCDRLVRFVIRRDLTGRIRFAPLNSDAGQRLLGDLHVPPTDSIVVIEADDFLLRSDAVLRILRELPRPWSVLPRLIPLPRSWRDLLYDVIARHRVKWFGRLTDCPLPEPAWKGRFLADALVQPGTRVAKEDAGTGRRVTS